MKNFTTLSVIALVMFLGFSQVSCKKAPKEKEVKGTVVANANGEILFQYSRQKDNLPDACKFTTDLPAPNDQFVITVTATDPTGKRPIDGLTPGQVVTWTATVEGTPLNHGSGNFVHIINN